MESLGKERVRHPIIEQDIAQVAQTVGPSLERLRGKRLLITGGTGFIGIWLLETIAWLNDQWDQPCRIYLPTRSPERFIRKVPHLVRADIVLLSGDVRAFEYPDDRCDMIIHAAAPADPHALDHDPLSVASIIVDGTRRALDLAAQKRVESFLLVSSGAVYGSQPPELERMPEDYMGAPDLANPRSAYGEAKRYAEVLCALYREKFGVPIRIARPFTFVGPYQDIDAGFAVTDFLKEGLQGLPLHIRGDGTTIRSYCYASDLTIALWKVLLEAPTGRAYNVGSEEPISILELAYRVAAVLDHSIEISVARTPIQGRLPARYVPDTSRGKAELGLTIRVDLHVALMRTLSWMRDAQNIL
jgi:dTDP-glucose 4,6-dehydratase